MGITESWDAGVGSLRALVPLSPSREHAMFAGVAQGFRAPNLSDLTRLDTARSNEIETPSPDLDPEEYVTYEIGIKSHIKDLSAKVGYYYTSIDNMIIRTPTGRTIDGDVEVTKKNSGEGYIQGVEGSLKYAFDRMWSAWISASWMEGEVDSYPTSNSSKQREYISRLAPPVAEIGVRLQSKRGDYWCETSVKSAGKADKLSADDTRDTQRIPVGGTPGYTVVNARTGGKLTSRISLTIALENIFDEDYRVHGSGVNEPGRNLVLTAVCDI
jgi:hemoglobin/transferrin/lactoferrin receptor protein